MMETLKQDLFGQEVSEIQPVRTRSGSYIGNPCISAFGAGPSDERCKNCQYLITKEYSKKYFKCALRENNSSATTDHRANWPACGKFLSLSANPAPESSGEDNLRQIKHQLEKGWRITVQSVRQTVGTQELRHYISRLKRDGIKIASEWKEANGKRFKEYYMPKAS